jgi:hypothetical protein
MALNISFIQFFDSFPPLLIPVKDDLDRLSL